MSDAVNLSLCMIVRDNENTIRPCLESVRPWVDELIVVDTGSVDETPGIVESYGARLFHFPWIDDFSASRNYSIDQATGRWIFWMDSDDTIPEQCGEKLRALARENHPKNLLGFVMQVRCPSSMNSGIDEFTVVDHVKMFRNRDDLRFEGPIHEQVMMPIRRLQGDIDWTDIYVVHSGSEHTPKSQQKKMERDLRILQIDLKKRPNHPFVLFNFAMTFAEANQFEEALGWIERCLAASQPHESHVAKTYAYWANCLLQLGQTEEALAACKQGRLHFPTDPELLFREAVTLHELGRLDESILRYREILAMPSRHQFQSTDPGITGFKCRFNLGVVLRDAGRQDEAEAQWRAVLREVPGYRPAYRALVQTLVESERTTAAQVEIDKMIESESACVTGMLLRAWATEGHGDGVAESLYQELLERFPDDLEVLEQCSRYYFENQCLEEAESALRLVLARDALNAKALHNLGAVFLLRGDAQLARSSLNQSLEVRPDSLRHASCLKVFRAYPRTWRQHDNCEAIRSSGIDS